MNVVLNIEPIRWPLTGIGRYTLELARHLSVSEKIDSLVFVDMFGRKRELPSGEQGFGDFAPALAAVMEMVKKTPYVRRALMEARHGLLIRRLARYREHVYHSPNFYLPPFSGPGVVSIHDLSVVDVPECHPPARVRDVRRAMEKAVVEATAVVTISEFSRGRIVAEYGVAPDKIFVTRLATSGVFRERNADEIVPCLTSLRLGLGKYCLFTGTLEPRKNIAVLLDAYELLPESIRNNYPLVIVGAPGWESDALRRRIRGCVDEGWLRHIGFVADETLSLLMGGAAMFLFPSLYEGFGLPPLEAMRCGAPVAAADATSLPEVVGNAGLLIPPHDANAWAEAIRRGVEDAEWRKGAVSAGFARANGFSWARCASETVEAYLKVATKN